MVIDIITGSTIEYTPEESALKMRLRIFVIMRWLAIGGVIVSALLASNVFNIGFPILPVYIICAFMFIYNMILFYQSKSLAKVETGKVLNKARSYGNLHISLDLVALTILLHFTGGIENPFIFYFVFHAISASIVLRSETTYILATAALAMVFALVGLEYSGWLPHNNLVGFADPALYKRASYVLPVLVTLTTVMYGATYMTTAISGELRRRQRQVMRLGNQLLRTKTEELDKEKEMQDKLSIAYQELSDSHQKLKESQEQLIQVEKLSSLGQLAASIAHEVNNPLSGVLVYTQLLAKKIRGGDYPQEVALEYLSKMETELTRSTKLIKNLLDFARQTPPAFRKINLNDVVTRSLDLTAHNAEMQHVKVVRELEQELPQVVADFDQLQQVFTNLILNAVQSMKEGGTLTIRTGVSSNSLKIAFQDTGHGISQANMNKLFTPFFTTKAEVKGVGLGLAVSYGIIQRHHGRIEVQSKPETGTTFSIYLPLHTGEHEATK